MAIGASSVQPRLQSATSSVSRPSGARPRRAESWGRLRGVSIAHLIEMDGPGGAERLVALLAGAVAVGGANSVAFLPEGGEGWLTRELRLIGITVEHVPVDSHRRTIAALESGFRRHDIAVAHSHEFAMGICGTVAARRTGSGHVITMHGGRHYASSWHRRLRSEERRGGKAGRARMARGRSRRQG